VAGILRVSSATLATRDVISPCDHTVILTTAVRSAAAWSHDPDDQGFAGGLDYFPGDDGELADFRDALDLGDEAAGQAEVPAGDTGDRGGGLAGSEVALCGIKD